MDLVRKRVNFVYLNVSVGYMEMDISRNLLEIKTTVRERDLFRFHVIGIQIIIKTRGTEKIIQGKWK